MKKFLTKYRLGIMSAILGHLDLEGALAYARDHGFTSIEVAVWPKGSEETRRYANVCHIDVDEYDVDAIRALEAKYGVKIASVGYYANPLSEDEDEAAFTQAHMYKVVLLAEALGVRMNTFIGRVQMGTKAVNEAAFLAFWPDFVNFAETHGVKIAIENCPMYFTLDEWPAGKNLASTPAFWRWMFGVIPNANFGLLFDPAHWVWLGIDLYELRPFADRLFGVHLKSARILRDQLFKVGIMAAPLEFHAPCIPGAKGDGVQWLRFFDLLEEMGYIDGELTLEVEDKEMEPGEGEDIEPKLGICIDAAVNFLLEV